MQIQFKFNEKLFGGGDVAWATKVLSKHLTFSTHLPKRSVATSAGCKHHECSSSLVKRMTPVSDMEGILMRNEITDHVNNVPFRHLRISQSQSRANSAAYQK